MRVNIIGSFGKMTGVAQDVSILHGLIAHVLGKETEIRHVKHFHPECLPADINFFVEVVNPSLLIYAGRNIWIPNPEWTYRTWEPYVKMMDEIWVKTRSAIQPFESAGGNVKYIGWTSIDKQFSIDRKDYSTALVPIGKNLWRNPKPIVQAYMRIRATDPALYARLPKVVMVYRIPLPILPESLNDKFTIYAGPDPLSDDQYNELVATCGLTLCISGAEGFGHSVNEAMSSGSPLLINPIAPFCELTDKAYWASTSKSIQHPTCFGPLEDTEVASIVDALKVYVDTSVDDKCEQSKYMRQQYEDRHETFVKTMQERIGSLSVSVPYSLEDRLPKEAELPCVSVITLTRDRRVFLPLARYCMVAQSYPESKIEWVIVDDGKDQIKDLVSDIPNVNYVLVDEPMTIGAKRNLAVSRASYNIVVVMDDDDVYPNNSILSRVTHLMMEPAKQCLFSTVIPCYDIHETKSFMNVPPITLPMSQRVSEATLCFTRDFWLERPFPDDQIGEGDAFIHGREQMCREISPQDVIVSLTHKKTTSARKAPPGESNGCHYGFSDELFTLVSEIAARI